jgi:hypothetical protein
MFLTFMHFYLNTSTSWQSEHTALVPPAPRLTPSLPSRQPIVQNPCGLDFLYEDFGELSLEDGYPEVFPPVESIPCLASSRHPLLDEPSSDWLMPVQAGEVFFTQGTQTTPPLSSTPILDCLIQTDAAL